GMLSGKGSVLSDPYADSPEHTQTDQTRNRRHQNENTTPNIECPAHHFRQYLPQRRRQKPKDKKQKQDSDSYCDHFQIPCHFFLTHTQPPRFAVAFLSYKQYNPVSHYLSIYIYRFSINIYSFSQNPRVDG